MFSHLVFSFPLLPPSDKLLELCSKTKVFTVHWAFSLLVAAHVFNHPSLPSCLSSVHIDVAVFLQCITAWACTESYSMLAILCSFQCFISISHCYFAFVISPWLFRTDSQGCWYYTLSCFIVKCCPYYVHIIISLTQESLCTQSVFCCEVEILTLHNCHSLWFLPITRWCCIIGNQLIRGSADSLPVIILFLVLFPSYKHRCFSSPDPVMRYER